MLTKYHATQKGFNVRLEVRLKNADLIRAREQLGIKSAIELARQIGISHPYYYRIESMQMYPSEKLQKRICDFFRERGLFLLEEYVFPKELKYAKPSKKYIAEREIPREQLISLSQVPERLLPVMEGQVEQIIYENEMNEELEEVLGTLTEREREVIKLRFGIGDMEGGNLNNPYKTLEEVGKILGVSGERIRQIEKRVLRKLRLPTNAKILEHQVYDRSI